MEYLKITFTVVQFSCNMVLTYYLYLMIKEYLTKKETTITTLNNFSNYSVVTNLYKRELSDDDVLRLEHLIKTYNEH